MWPGGVVWLNIDREDVFEVAAVADQEPGPLLPAVWAVVPRRRGAAGELVPAAAHITEQYANYPIEADHARLKARLRPMRGLKRFRSAAAIATGRAFVQNFRRGHYELATDASPPLRLATAFSELALAM